MFRFCKMAPPNFRAIGARVQDCSRIPIPIPSQSIPNPCVSDVDDCKTLHCRPSYCKPTHTAPSITRVILLDCSTSKSSVGNFGKISSNSVNNLKLGSRYGNIFGPGVHQSPLSLVYNMQQRYYRGGIGTFYKHVNGLFTRAVATTKRLFNYIFRVLLVKKGQGTLIIISRGDDIEAISVGADGMSWLSIFGWLFPVAYKSEKVITINSSLLVVKGGTSLFANYLIEHFKSENFVSAMDCAISAQDFMFDSPFESVVVGMEENEKLATLAIISLYGEPHYLDFTLYFVSKNQVVCFNGYDGSVLEYVDILPEAVGMCQNVAFASLAKSRAEGISTDKSLMRAFADSHRSSSWGEAVGGRIIIKKVSSKGVDDVWDGDIKDMIKTHLQD